jgi:hypothetical protein
LGKYDALWYQRRLITSNEIAASFWNCWFLRIKPELFKRRWYDIPTAFKERLAKDLKRILHKRLDKADTGLTVPAAPVWDGSPYPGLRAFTLKEGPIFYGRGREVDALIARLRDPAQRFLAVVGASGTGKSSLVQAGLIPRLQDGAIEGSQHWRVITCTPGATGENPFLALAVKLEHVLPAHVQKSSFEIATELAEAPQRLTERGGMLLAGQTDSAMLILFIDQLEELFTGVNPKYQRAFAELLAHAAGDPRLRDLPPVWRTPLLAHATKAVTSNWTGLR